MQISILTVSLTLPVRRRIIDSCLIVGIVPIVIKILVIHIRHILQSAKCLSLGRQFVLNITIVKDNDGTSTREVIGQYPPLLDTSPSLDRSIYISDSSAPSKNVLQVPWPASINDPDLDSMILHRRVRLLFQTKHLVQIYERANTEAYHHAAIAALMSRERADETSSGIGELSVSGYRLYLVRDICAFQECGEDVACAEGVGGE